MKRFQTAVVAIIGIAMVGAAGFWAFQQRSPYGKGTPTTFDLKLHPTLQVGTISVPFLWPSEDRRASFVSDIDGDRIPDLAINAQRVDAEDELIVISTTTGEQVARYTDGENYRVTVFLDDLFGIQPGCVALIGGNEDRFISSEPYEWEPEEDLYSPWQVEIEGRSYEIIVRGSDSVTIRDQDQDEILFSSRLVEQREGNNPDAHWGSCVGGPVSRAAGSVFFFGDRPRELRFHPEIQLIEHEPIEVSPMYSKETVLDEFTEHGRIRFLAESDGRFVEVVVRQGMAPVFRELGIAGRSIAIGRHADTRYVGSHIQAVEVARDPKKQTLRVLLPGASEFVETEIPTEEFPLSGYGEFTQVFTIPDCNGDGEADLFVGTRTFHKDCRASWRVVSGATGRVLPRTQ